MKDRVVHVSAGLQDFDSALLDNLKTVSMSPLDKSQYVSISFTSTLLWEKKKINLLIYHLKLWKGFRCACLHIHDGTSVGVFVRKLRSIEG